MDERMIMNSILIKRIFGQNQENTASGKDIEQIEAFINKYFKLNS